MKTLLLSLMVVYGSVNAVNAMTDISIAKQEKQVLTTSTFSPIDRTHDIEGSLKIEEVGGKILLTLNDDFKVQRGPDLRVVLRDPCFPEEMVVVAKLTSFNGKQVYELPVSKEMLKDFSQVVIYCAKFHVDFGIADIVIE